MWHRLARAMGWRDAEWGDWHTLDDVESPRYRAIADLYARFASNAPVLDLGCGTGPLLAHLPPNLPYLGIDCQPAAVARAQSRCRSHQRIICGDICDRALLHGFACGCVVFSEVLYYQPSTQAALALLSAYVAIIQPPAVLLISIWIDQTKSLPRNADVLAQVRRRYRAQICADEYVSARPHCGWHLLAIRQP